MDAAPVPDARDDVVEAMPRLPAQLPAGPRDVRHQALRVPRARRAEADLDLAPRHAARRVDQLQHRGPPPGPEVVDAGFLQGLDVGAGDVFHVDVVADRRAVAVDGEGLAAQGRVD